MSFAGNVQVATGVGKTMGRVGSMVSQAVLKTVARKGCTFESCLFRHNTGRLAEHGNAHDC